MGGVGSTGNWQHGSDRWYGLQKMKYNGQPVFEMLAVRAKSDGMEIEFTQPLPEGIGWEAGEYHVEQWRYVPTIEYGGPKVDLEKLPVRSANVSADRRRVFLELGGMKSNHVVYLRIPSWWTSEDGQELWATECWYTLNIIPSGNLGKKTEPVVIAPNTLTESEKKAGWKLLFDGKTLDGWRNYGKATIGSDWVVEDGSMHLNATQHPDGHWQTVDGGDIITDGEYENFELSLEWKISPCGNSGIFYNVVESDEYEYGYQTGPEMQVLDNTCHPDAFFPAHRAGDLYDMIECEYETVNPANEWNRVRLISRDGNVEHWLNGRRVVAFQMHNAEWEKMIANSKFHDWPGFGKAKKGHISLQDHGDKVWFRNIKIREL
jgi:cytochrome c